MLKKTVVFINPTNPDPPPNYFGPPYGLSLLGASLLKDRRPVKAYDFDPQPLSLMLSSIKDIIRRDKPRYIGIPIQSSTRGSVYELIKAIKETDKSIVIILGGAFASAKYELLLRNFPVDYAVIGDGERTLVELLQCLENGGELKGINGIAFLLKNHLYVTEERRKEANLDLLPHPAFYLFKGFDEKINSAEKGKEKIPNFILGKRCTTLKNALMLLSSRGCIYNCNFCPMSKVLKDKIRFHSPAYFVDMVEYFYKKYRIKDYVFGDNTFTLVRKRVMEICEGIIRKNIKIKWGCMTRSDYVDSELLSTMARAGCFEISYGVESGSPKIQKTIKKNLDLALTKEAFKITKKAGIRSILMLMVGNLGESDKTIEETLSYVKDIDPGSVLVKIAKVYPGTDIHDMFEKNGLLKRNYYLTPEFKPPSFTLEYSKEELQRFSRMINTRTTFIQINNTCNNNCAFCLLNSKGTKDSGEIKKELILASARGEHIVLTGGEPFLRKDFFQILDYADKLEVHHLYIYSNGRMFFYEALAKKIGKVKSLRKIIIPFFGFSEIHDGVIGVSGAFSQTVAGIKNIKSFSSHLEIQANIFILGLNYKSLLKLTRFLSNLGVDEFRFIFLKNFINPIEIAVTDFPSMSAAITRLKEIARFLNQADKTFYFEGFPLCVLKNYKENLSEPYSPFDEIITLEKKMMNCRELRGGEKRKFSYCSKCKENNLCEGVWKKYYQVYGNSEFEPC